MTEYLDLSDYLLIAERITGIDADVLATGTSVDLADSALNAPQATFAGYEFYPLLPMKAAVLCWHLARNHPLPDGNKRSAWISMLEFLERNGYTLRVEVDDAVALMNTVAAGVTGEETLATWVFERMHEIH